MQRTWQVAFIVFGLLAATPAWAKVRVVTTVPDLAALARAIGGDKILVESLSLPTQDPHYVDAKPSLALKLNKAQLLIAAGLGLEIGWLPNLRVSARNGRIQVGGSGYLDCSKRITVLDVPRGKVSRAMGDIHPQGNPHYLLDPRQAKRCAKAIADSLTIIDATNAGHYYTAYAAFSKALDLKRSEWTKKYSAFKGVRIITYHKSLGYLANFAGFDVVDVLEPKPGVSPSPAHIARVIAKGRKLGVKLVLQEEYYPTRTGKLVAKKIGANLVRISGGASSSESYLQNMGEILASLAKGL
jgi:zinc/manganese transport system substrate-binding protein